MSPTQLSTIDADTGAVGNSNVLNARKYDVFELKGK
jgi:hypothetical protein